MFERQPEGFVVEGKEHLVCRLQQSLYGLKQSLRCWNSTLAAHLKDMGYVQSTNDLCIYTSSEGKLSIIGVYVDDFVVTGESSERIEQVKAALAQKFDVKDLGELHYFLECRSSRITKRAQSGLVNQPSLNLFSKNMV